MRKPKISNSPQIKFLTIPKNLNRTLYKAYFAQRFMELVHTAFVAKSLGNTDSLGNKWKPLARSTQIYKPLMRGEASSYGVRQYKSTRGLLTPLQDRIWRRIFYFQSRKKNISNEQAARMAWAAVKNMGARTKLEVFASRKTKINVRTGRLEKSLTPGKVVGSRYVPPNSDQQIIFSATSMQIRIKVPYADDVHAVRRLIPAHVRPWIKDAHESATRKLFGSYK